MNTFSPGDRVRCTMTVPKWSGQIGTIKEPARYPPGVYLVAMDIPELNIGRGFTVLSERFLEKIEPER